MGGIDPFQGTPNFGKYPCLVRSQKHSLSCQLAQSYKGLVRNRGIYHLGIVLGVYSFKHQYAVVSASHMLQALEPRDQGSACRAWR